MSKINKHVCLDDLKRKNNGNIDWRNSIGCVISFTYDNIQSTIEIVNYNSENYKISIKYDNEVYWVNSDTIIQCGFGRILKKTTNEFKIDVGKRFIDTNRDITIVDRVLTKGRYGRLFKFYTYKCNICNWGDGTIEESNLLNGGGCSCCSGRTVVEGINDIPTTAPWMVDYFQGGYEEAKQYTKRSGKYINPCCPNCGRVHDKKIRISDIYRRNGFSCICSSDKISYPEKFIWSLLDYNNINFVRQFSRKNSDWVDKYKYDFYLPDYNMIIEVNGMQHYKETSFSKLKKTKRNRYFKGTISKKEWS